MKIALQENFLSQFQRNEEWILFIFLVSQADKEGKVCMSQSTIEKALSLSRSVVRRNLSSLEEKKFIFQDSSNQATEISILKGAGYTITLPTQKEKVEKHKDSPEEIAFQAWIKEEFPEVAQMKYPLTWERMQRIKKRYPDKNAIIDALGRMDNWKLLNKKRSNAYRTLLEFLKPK